MRVAHAFDLELATIKDQIYAGLQEVRPQEEVEKLSPIIESAFKKGSEMWRRKHLPDVLGKELAEQFDDATRKATIGPDMLGPHT
jgi:hypothetical protein